MIQKSYSDGDKLYRNIQKQVAQIDMSGVLEAEELSENDETGNENDKTKNKKKKENLSFPAASIDFTYLKSVNPDICGWIYLYDSIINYPIVQGSDNETYLTHAYDKQYSTFGSIFVDMQNSNDFTDRNTIIYGHNMKNGSMFGVLKQYQNESYYQGHKYIYIFTESKIYRYEVCSIYTTTADSDIYTTTYNEKEDWIAYEQKILNNSIIDTNVSLEKNDTIITLSTCYGVHTENRFVVQAKLVAEKDVE